VLKHLPHQAAVALSVCWGAFLLTWLVSAALTASRGSRERAESPLSSLLLPVFFGVFLVSTVIPWGDWSPLQVRAHWVHLLGVGILVTSTAFTLWAGSALGITWSESPAAKERHQLRTEGPYAITRHPIYTGILGMALGSALVANFGPWALPFPVLLVGLIVKMRLEERLMLSEFPDEYLAYQRRVPQLVPGLRVLSRPARASSTTA
jgi:protein-S-isoprenylcysteine O-methyltransferase Ste14